MVDDELIKLAQAYRVGTRYEDWRGRETAVGRDTIVAVLGALGVDASSARAVRAELARLAKEERTRLLPPVVVYRMGGVPRGRGALVPDEIRIPVLTGGDTEMAVELSDGSVLEPLQAGSDEARTYRLPEDTPLGWHRLHVRQGPYEQSAALMVAPSRLGDVPRAWGLMTQLYSVRSKASWGMGDLHDLGELARWSGAMGAGFVLVNPLHATEPAPPVGPSPYSPMSRRFASPLYLRVEDVPEYGLLDPDERQRITAPAVQLRELEVIDRDAVWTAKRAALALLHRLPRGTERQRAYEEFRRREGEPLTAFATWSALAEVYGTDWRRWPAELRDAKSPAVAAERERRADRVDFHRWLQWQLDQQFAGAQSAAREAGMPIGIVNDLAVGVSHGSADTWTYRELFAQGMSVGAPPDEFNQRGQDWGQPPWHPHRLSEAAYGPYREILAAALRHGGGLRLDHAMQVSRLWWVPEGSSPMDGTYVWYDRNAMLSCLALEAEQAGAVVIGEDLGTVEPEVRDDLADRNILGTSLLWFERDQAGLPKPPSRWREQSLATVGTHDMPPIVGFVHGDHIALRDQLGLLTEPVGEERMWHGKGLAEWFSLLDAEGLLASPPARIVSEVRDGSRAYDAEVVYALHAFLARTPARLLGISLADVVGERRTQNQPGTTDEYPNWRVPLADSLGRPVLLEDLQENRAVRAVLAPVMR